MGSPSLLTWSSPTPHHPRLVALWRACCLLTLYLPSQPLPLPLLICKFPPQQGGPRPLPPSTYSIVISMYVHIGLRMVNPDPSGRKQQATSHPQYKAIAFDFDLDVHCQSHLDEHLASLTLSSQHLLFLAHCDCLFDIKCPYFYALYHPFSARQEGDFDDTSQMCGPPLLNPLQGLLEQWKKPQTLFLRLQRPAWSSPSLFL